MIVRKRLDACIFDAEFDEVQRDQRDDIHAFTEADDRNIDIFQPERLKRAFVGGVGKDRLRRILCRLLDRFLVEIDRDNLRARLKKRPRRR